MVLIVIEGADGAGKSTLAGAVYKKFQDLGMPCVLTREPGGTPFAEQLRALLKTHGSGSNQLSSWERLCVLAACRAHHVRTVIKPSLCEGKIVVCDRFMDSTYVYQGVLEGTPKHHIDALMQPALQGLCPDVVLVLTASCSTRMERLSRRQTTEHADYYKQDDFLDPVQQAFTQWQGAYPCGTTPARINIDSAVDKNQVFTCAWQAIQPYLRKPHP